MLARIRIMRITENFLMFCLTRKNTIGSKKTEKRRFYLISQILIIKNFQLRSAEITLQYIIHISSINTII